MKKWRKRFNDFFTEIGPQLDKEIPQSKRPGGCKIYLNSRIPNSSLISTTNPQEISDIINNFDDSKASGPCSVPIKLLKVARHELSNPFSEICNTSFTESIFPEIIKVAKFHLIRKDPLMMLIIIVLSHQWRS